MQKYFVKSSLCILSQMALIESCAKGLQRNASRAMFLPADGIGIRERKNRQWDEESKGALIIACSFYDLYDRKGFVQMTLYAGTILTPTSIGFAV